MNQLINTQTTMSSREIAELVEARHNDVVVTIERLFSKGLLRSSRKTRREATGGRPVEVYDLIERDTHLVVAGYSDEHRAKVIDRWQELETGAAQPALMACPPAEEALRVAALLNQHLRLEGSAALGTVRQALALKAPEYLPLLPGYAVDAPPSELTTRGSSRPTMSMTAILKAEKAQSGATWTVSTKAVSRVNEVLVALGLLEQRTRSSTTSITGTARFMSITDKGLEYGKNVTNEKNQRETAPHWYADKAAELLDLVLAHAGTAKKDSE